MGQSHSFFSGSPPMDRPLALRPSILWTLGVYAALTALWCLRPTPRPQVKYVVVPYSVAQPLARNIWAGRRIPVREESNGRMSRATERAGSTRAARLVGAVRTLSLTMVCPQRCAARSRACLLFDLLARPAHRRRRSRRRPHFRAGGGARRGQRGPARLARRKRRASDQRHAPPPPTNPARASSRH